MHRIRPRALPQTFFQPKQTFNHVPFRTYQKLPFGRSRPQYQRFSARGGIASFFTNWAARPTFYRDVGLITAGGGTVYVLNLETVPVSGRRRFNFIPTKMEAALGESTVAEIKQQYAGRFLDDADPRSRLVKRVLERLLPFAFKEGDGLAEMEWEVHVIDSPEMNAFVVPGGKVFVFTGILPHCRDEDGVAAVLGHEIAHVLAHHTAERMSQAPLILIPILASLAFDVSFYSANMILQLFLSMPASRKHEAEADYIGLLMAAQACYRPEAAMEFWARMEKSGQHGPPQILSTHPSNHNREEKIREWLPKAHEQADMSECAGTGQSFESFKGAFGGFGGGERRFGGW
ncbi:peptidase family M48-domain-containing protein [Boeremia exigua]|uniref:peptidase family M48-domain-containing protein n=1 Tax=Boeremia exigua TaxID=749465 RepID=UPI001E8CD9FD|nr:peptidase family M48-domain-containing protein [Boeremia exigua]KAH6625581.1 peptidase family M48-domain-containing protein [Boeremia exigua]